MVKDDRKVTMSMGRQIRDESVTTGFLDLLRQIPTEQFVRMVSKSGLTSKQQRQMCLDFKRLKAEA